MNKVKQMYHVPKENRLWIALLAIIVVICLASCGTTIKNKSSYKAKNDTIAEENKGIDTSKISESKLQENKQEETTAGSQEESDVKKELNIDFGNGTAEDYAEKDTTVNGLKVETKGTGTLKFNPDGSFEASGVKNAKYKEDSKTKKQDSSHTKSSTDTKLEVTDQKKGIDTGTQKIVTHSEVAINSKDVKRKSNWEYLWLLLIPIIWLGGWWIGLWPLFPKRKKKDDNPEQNKA